MTTRIGRFSHRHRWTVLFIWLVAVTAGALAAPMVFERMADGNQLRDTESAQGRDVLSAASDRGGVVVALWEGIAATAPDTVDRLATLRRELAAIPGVNQVDPPTTADDGTGVAIQVVIAKVSDEEQRSAVDLVSSRLRALAESTPGSTVHLGGSKLVNRQVNDAVQEDLNRAEFTSLPITLLVMIFVFGGLIAAGLPVLATVATVAGAFGMLLGFSEFVDLDANIISVVSMLGLALCIDYSLLLVSRYREELALDLNVDLAISRTWATAGRTIAFSALIVAASLSGLLFFDVPRLQAMGAAGISATVIAMLSALTLTAALLRLFARRIKPARRTVTGNGFARLARLTQRRPVLFALGATAVLLAMASPLLSATVKLPDTEGLPRSIESVQVIDDLAARYGVQDNPAITVVARTSASALDSWATRWTADPLVSKVDAARDAAPGLAVVSLTVHGDNQSSAARDLAARMRADRPTGVESWVTGDAAVITDLRAKLAAGLPYALGITVLAMFVLLFLMTGSLMVPVKALLMNFVSLGATFGVLALVFEHGWLAGPLDTLTVGGLSPFVIVLVFAFGFGMSMDYEVFLLGRIKEFVDAGEDTDAAVRKGLQASGRIITSAAVLMLIVFGFFAAARVGDLEQIGLGLFVAILIDATIVRCILVPATMTLLGRWNWWAPAPLRSLHARIGLRH